LEKKEDIAKNIRILGHRLRQFCDVLQALPVTIQPDLVVALYLYQQALTEQVKRQLQKYVMDDDELRELLKERLFQISLSELLCENLIIPEGNKNK
jgi:hypothetical protein